MPSADQLKVFSDIASSALDDLSLSLQGSNDKPMVIQNFRDSFDDLAMAAEIIEFETLGEICKEYSKSFFDSQDDEIFLSPQKSQELALWSNDLISFIRTPESIELAEKITTVFPEPMRNRWLDSLFPENSSTVLEHQNKIDTPLSINTNDPTLLFIEELTEMEESLDNLLCSILSPTEEDSSQSTKKYLKKFERISCTADILGMQGIVLLCDFIIRNMSNLHPTDDNCETNFELFSTVPRKIITLLSNIGDTQNILDIVTHCEDLSWNTPNQEEESHKLITLLSETDFEIEGDQENEQIKLVATEEDVSLMLSEDVHPDLIAAFLHDVPNQASELSDCISSIRNSNELSLLLEQAQRLTHAIKGSANIVEIMGIANMAHYLEEALDKIHQDKNVLTTPLNSLLEESSDCIESMVDHLLGKDNIPVDSQSLLQQLLNYANGNPDTQETRPPKVTPTPNKNEIKNIENTEKTSAPTKSIESFIQVPTKTIEALFEMVEEMTISLIQTREQVKGAVQRAKDQSIQDEKIQEHRFELEKIIDIKALSSSKRRHSYNENTNDQFDSLELDQYSEIHGTVHSFIETVIDSRELNIDMQEQLLHLDSLFVKHLRLNKDLQFLTKSTKMVPVTSINSRLQRCVRHASRITNKTINLTITDNNLAVDEEVLTKLTDPLMHILRNAIDHGIEDSSQRQRLHKSDSGNLSITFSQLGNHICVQCVDDGKGLDSTAIYNTAVKKGLLPKDQTLTEKQCIDLLLTSGFSTRESVDQLSGRGVGLDVVNTCIKTLNGKLEISSQPDEGTTVSVTVPLSHLSTHAIIISLNYERYAIPSHSLSQLLPPHSGEIVKVGEHDGYRYNDTVYPLVTIGNLLLGKSSHHNKQHITIDNLPILLLEVENTTYALAVDSIQSNQDIIIKSMGGQLNKTYGVNGVATIADGTLIPVLDIVSLITGDNQQGRFAKGEQSTESSEAILLQKTILIVDDSLSVRRSLDQLMTDMGYNTLLAQDGVQAVELLETVIPDVVLTDMEMPRMNGLELTSYIKNSERLHSVPVVMITSRSTAKHRTLADKSGVNHYLTKPYTESELLDLVNSLIPTTASIQPLH